MNHWRAPAVLHDRFCPECDAPRLRYLVVVDEAGSEYVARERCSCGYEKIYDKDVAPESATNQ